jgi:DNA repair protein RadC
MKKSLPLFTEQDLTLAIPRYSIKLVRESQLNFDNRKVQSARMVCDILKEIGLNDRASEELHVLYLNTKHQVIGVEMISRGTLNSSLVHPREVFKGAILANAHAIIIAHNHPSGNTSPSSADKSVTETLVKAGNLLDVKVIDHVIIGQGEEFFSFKTSTTLIE